VVERPPEPERENREGRNPPCTRRLGPGEDLYDDKPKSVTPNSDKEFASLDIRAELATNHDAVRIVVSDGSQARLTRSAWY